MPERNVNIVNVSAGFWGRILDLSFVPLSAMSSAATLKLVPAYSRSGPEEP